MKEEYQFRKIEKKWIKKWELSDVYKAKNNSNKKKFYGLVEFPYPSAQGLHVGHPRGYTAIDIISRKKRMEGYNVLFPMGWDAFGLPAENYAIKTGKNPKDTTTKNIKNFKRQLKSLGFSFDWTREINTTDPNYYKWTQWIFLQFFKHGLAYKKLAYVNWCTSCNITLANEEVVDGKCERCKSRVVKKNKSQWMLKITQYAEKLINNLKLLDFPERVKKQQIDWIGKSEGATIKFKLTTSGDDIDVFTTRPDTLFGATFLVISPEHKLVNKITTQKYKEKIKAYQNTAKDKPDIERTKNQKDKTGVFTGAYAINPANNEKIPVWISEYVLITYGTGAIMAVPAHDQRDFEFAKKFNLPIKEVISKDGKKHKLTKATCDDGILINSGEFNGENSEKAKEKIIKYVNGKKDIQYKLHDWIFSRQHYWGEPIPLVYCEVCAEKIKTKKILKSTLSDGEKINPGWFPVREENLPIKLPNVKNFKTTKKGDSPLAKYYSWINTKCPKCGSNAKRETDTMPQWAGSSWYYLRYTDPHNDNKFASKKALKYWLPVDWYNGGPEHTTLHLLYSRFWHEFLYDIGMVPTPEPYAKRTSHGMILGKGGEKMSKSKGNVVNPDDMVNEFGADSFRIYEMFMGPFEDSIKWNEKGILGAERFLNKIWNMRKNIVQKPMDKTMLLLTNKTIKKVTEDIEKTRFNTAISTLMIMATSMNKLDKIPKKMFETFILLLSPFAPFICDEVWSIEHKNFIQKEKWPSYDKKYIKNDFANIAVQINGKTRAIINVEKGLNKKDITNKAILYKKLGRYNSEMSNSKKIIYVQDRVINFII